ncbi:conserved hypothetical protein [Neospora caninum Liverpool]|nr:conserved hypothetical protein [Neospora caninum Liverpool]CBZ50153.1 conserved hypothetical protein [Neospora caninum Liverpool]|eukprot:XP_003880188.1 conserved hypothetical protein [Neospora caninum Liverpool]
MGDPAGSGWGRRMPAPSPASPAEGGRLLVEPCGASAQGHIVKGNLRVRGNLDMSADYEQNEVFVDRTVAVQGLPETVSEAGVRSGGPAGGRAPEPAETDEGLEEIDEEEEDGAPRSLQKSFRVKNKVTVEGRMLCDAASRKQTPFGAQRRKRFFSTDEGLRWSRNRGARLRAEQDSKFVASFTQDGELLVNARSVEYDPAAQIRRNAARRLLRSEYADQVPGSISGRLLIPYLNADVRELLRVSEFCDGEGWRVLEEIRRLLVLRKGRLTLSSDRNAFASRRCLAFLAKMKRNAEAHAKKIVRQGPTARFASVETPGAPDERGDRLGNRPLLTVSLHSGRVNSPARPAPRGGRDEAWEQRAALIKDIRRSFSLASTYSTKGRKQPAVYIQLAALKPAIVMSCLSPDEVAMTLLEVFQSLWLKFVDYSLRRRVRVSTAALVLDFSSLTEADLSAGGSHFLLSVLGDVVRAFTPLLIKKVVFYNSVRAGEYLWDALRPAIEHSCFFTFCPSDDDLASEIEGERTMIYHTTGLANDLSLLTNFCPLYALYGPPMPTPERLFPLRPSFLAPSLDLPRPARRPIAVAWAQILDLLAGARVRLTDAADTETNCRGEAALQRRLAQTKATAQALESLRAAEAAGSDEATETLLRGDQMIKKICDEEATQFWRGMSAFHDMLIDLARRTREAETGEDGQGDLNIDQVDRLDPDGHLGPSEQSLRHEQAADDDDDRSHAERVFERIFNSQHVLEETVQQIGEPFEDAWENSVQDAFDASVKDIREKYLPLSSSLASSSACSSPPLARPFPVPLNRVCRRQVSVQTAAEPALLGWQPAVTWDSQVLGSSGAK